MATATPLLALDAVLRAPDLARADQALLDLLPDRPHLDALLHAAAQGPEQALAMALVGIRVRDLGGSASLSTTQRLRALESLRSVFAAG